jgi:hypothetical protein
MPRFAAVLLLALLAICGGAWAPFGTWVYRREP